MGGIEGLTLKSVRFMIQYNFVDQKLLPKAIGVGLERIETGRNKMVLATQKENTDDRNTHHLIKFKVDARKYITVLPYIVETFGNFRS